MGIPIKPCPKCRTNEWTPGPPFVCKECCFVMDSSYLKKEEKKKLSPLDRLVACRKYILSRYGEAEVKKFDKRMEIVMREEAKYHATGFYTRNRR